VLMGLGMGMTMSPMSTAAMNAVPAAKAGVASGILSMSRMVGGTFGVAAIGALFQTLSKSRLSEHLAGLHLSGAQSQHVADALGSGQAKQAVQSLDPQTAQQVTAAMKDSFVHALSGSLKLSTAVAAAGAVVAFALIESTVGRRAAEPAAEPVGV
jgi:hypothetical protein